MKRIPTRRTRRTRRVVVAAATAVGCLTTVLAGSGEAASTPGTYVLLPPNIQVAETDAGRPVLIVTVSLNQPNDTGRTLAMNYWECIGQSFCHTTAEAGVDYEPFAPDTAPGSVRFRPGQQTSRFEVTLIGDQVPEPDEVIDVRFDSAIGPWNLPVTWDNNAEIQISNDD